MARQALVAVRPPWALFAVRGSQASGSEAVRTEAVQLEAVQMEAVQMEVPRRVGV